ncbi:helix-turn-helix domain-containing protein [Asanoa sp. WMMD1127]|uniref:helix-turn-helix domain-containing protein n=1 Tax=Asanoa sp. WMMD1127 TaxID=3016107 RepID=UPI002417AEF0|nr:helix-turn-helix domain-containing protein [Asanoa sp. WMMD1127]MDG4826582.1 helix-turn-helix domain-containing protein [Asanoa sp. WMMD1127]
MLSSGTPPDWASVEVAIPTARLPGVSMAGFRQRVPAAVHIGMVAHPSVTVLVDLSAGLVCESHGRRSHGSVVAGLLTPDLRVGGQGAGACLQIRLAPAAAAAVLGGAAALSGQLVDFGDVFGRGAELFEHRLRAAPSWEARFAIVTEVVGRRMADRAVVDPEVAHAWRLTLASRGRRRVEGLADEVGWSRKRLWARFRSQVGISPKRAAQLVRFDHAAHLLAGSHSPATVAAAAGYVDQPHLNREARSICGLTPTAVASAPWLAIDDVAWPAVTVVRP